MTNKYLLNVGSVVLVAQEGGQLVPEADQLFQDRGVLCHAPGLVGSLDLTTGLWNPALAGHREEVRVLRGIKIAK